MATLESAVRIWRQVKRVIAAGALGVGVFLLWQLSTGDLQGPVMLFLGALLTGVGVVGVLFPSKVRVFNTRGGPE